MCQLWVTGLPEVCGGGVEDVIKLGKEQKAQRIEELSLANFFGGKAIQVRSSKINFYIMKKRI